MSDYSPTLCHVRIDRLTILLSVRASSSATFVTLRKSGVTGDHNTRLEDYLKKNRDKLKKIQKGQDVPLTLPPTS